MNKLFTQTGIGPVCRQLRRCLKKHSMHRLAAIMLIIQLCCVSAFAQNKAVKGVVKDEKGQPVAGASVKLKGTTTGTATGVSGEYSLQVSGSNPVLVFTLIGFTTKEVAVGNQTDINISFAPEATSLNEVVVIGYGTARKSDLTGAVGQVKSAQLQERPSASLNQSLAGRVAGVQVNTNSGRPGGQTNIRVRGFSSINTSNNPLYVIDGVILPVGNQTQNSNAIDYINPADIASVEILKDASATAIYGARGANGVVLVTTKRGNSGGGKITYDVDFSVPTIGPQRVEMLDANEFIQVENLAYDNIKVYDPVGWAAGSYSSVVDPRNKRTDPRLFNNGQPIYNTDWLKESTQNKLSQNHQLAFTGGNNDSQYGAFIGYRDDNGLLLNSYLNRYSGRFTFDSKLKDWIKVGGSLSYNNQEENIVDTRSGALNSTRMITEALPFLPIKYPDGTYAANYQYPGVEGGSNPVEILNESRYLLRTQTSLGNIYANINLAKGLELKSVLGANIITRGIDEYFGKNLDQLSRQQKGTALLRSERESYWSFENYLTYNKKFGEDHSFTGLAGISFQQTNTFAFDAQGQNFLSDFIESNNLRSGDISTNLPTSGRTRFAFNSYFARLNYSFKERYLFTFTGRTDGASKFGIQNKYAFFPSAAFAWRASDEEFLKDNPIVSNLKLRTSYGQTGNSEILTYQSLGLLGTGYSAIFSNTRFVGLGTNRLANPDLKWERTAQTDAGLELGLFKNRINIEADIYYRKTTGMLLNAPLPQSSGYSSITRNVGSLENKGLELGISSVNFTNDNFSWNTSFNISFNRNKVLSLATPADIFGGNPNFVNNTGVIRVGQSVGSFYGLVRLGTWSESERAEAAKFASYRAGKTILPGDLKYKDLNGDYVINDADRQIIGNNNPDAFGSLINNVKYKNIDFTFDLQYSYGNDVLNQTRHSGEDRQGLANSFTTVLNAWTPQNQNTDIAAIRDTRAGYVTNVDSHWVEDGSFLRGRNAVLGYTFPVAVTQKLKLSRLRIYASAQNFFLITKYNGNDPEVTTYGDAFAQGQTFFDYPKPTTYLLGLNIGL